MTLGSVFVLFGLLISNCNVLSIKVNSLSSYLAASTKEKVKNQSDDSVLDNHNDIKADTYYVEVAVKNYLFNLVSAINNNNFAKVEKSLLPGSKLYKAQKNLVTNLYQKKIKEELEDYRVENIEDDYKNDRCKVYTYEKIKIVYPSGKSKKSECYWVYIVVTYNNPKNFESNGDIDYRLSDIEKWNKK